MTVVPSTRVDVDAGLVEALRREEPGAAEQLVERFGDRVYRLAMRITGSNEDAEEAAQDALLQVARTLAGFEGRSRFTTWLHVVVANCARATYRSLRRRAAERGTRRAATGPG